MAKLLDIGWKDIYFQLEISLEEVTYLKDIFDHASIYYDGEKEPEMKKADEYLQEKLYPFLSGLKEKAEE